MVREISSIVLQNYYDRQITVNRIINSSILNYILNAFDYNDRMYKDSVAAVYNYGPKAFLKQLSTETGSCDISSSFPYVDYDVRTRFLEDDRNLSGYQYKVKGYKIWANTVKMNDSILSEELINGIKSSQQIKNFYKTISCDLTADVYSNLSQALDPEVYVKTSTNDLSSDQYLNMVTTLNPYYISNETEKLPSYWKGEYHNTYDYSMISHIVSTYLLWHENTVKTKSYDRNGHDKYGCYDHSTDSSQFFKGKLQKEIYDDTAANNLSSLNSNAYANTIISCFSGNATIAAIIHNPQTACQNTSPIPTTGDNGYEITDTKLLAAYQQYSITKNIKLTYDYIQFVNNTFQLMIKIDGFDNIYINEITNNTIDSSSSFSSNNGSSNGNRSLVFFNLPLSPASKNVNFKTYIANVSYDGTGEAAFYGSSKIGYLVNDTESYYRSLKTYNGPTGQNIIPDYVDDQTVQHLIVSKVSYYSPSSGETPAFWYGDLNVKAIKSDWDSNKNSHHGSSNSNYTSQRSFQFTSKSGLNKTGGIIGTVKSTYANSEACDTIIHTCGPGTGHMFKRVMFQPLHSIGYNSGWTKTTATFNLETFIKTRILGDRKIGTIIPIIQASSIAENRYQFGTDNANYVQTKITNSALNTFTIEMFNSEEQELMIRGSLS